MEYTPKFIRKTLKKTISEISSNPQFFSKNPEKDFSRTRKLPFEKVVNSILTMSCKDLKCEFMDFFGFEKDLPTVSAFVQQRGKISSFAFETLFKNFETSFRTLKYTLGLVYFHSKKEEYIIQEIFAKLTMYNFTELITSHVVIRKSNRKHPCKANFSASVHICRSFFLKNISSSVIEALIAKYVVPIRRCVSNPRKMNSKTAVCFLYRVA